MLAKIRFPEWSLPVALLAAGVAAFGLLIPSLGFYWDDWPVILVARTQGVSGFSGFYLDDRPLSAWTYMLTLPVLGTAPLGWHIFSLILRWLTTTAVWWCWRQLWPEKKLQAALAALLFLVYPVFTQQPISVAYSQHWICYLLFAASLALMIQAVRTPRWYYLLMGLSVVASGVQMFTMEYFIGLELLRPVILWVLFANSEEKPRRLARQVGKNWLPYLLVLVVFVVWRLFFLKLRGDDPNSPGILFELLKTPLPALLHLLQIALQDGVHVLVSAWYSTLKPELVDLNDRFLLLSWLVGLFSAAGLAVYLLRIKIQDKPSGSRYRWALQAGLVGLLGVVLGTLPVWLTDRQMIVGMYSNRFGLPAMLGASLFWVALIDFISESQRVKVILLALMVGLAVGFHLRSENEYRWSWTLQSRFYWQLKWRAPAVEPQTAFFSDGEIFPYVGLYSTSAGINLLYSPQGSQPLALPYWFYSLGRGYSQQVPDLQKGLAVKEEFRGFTFDANGKNSLLISYEPSQGRCLTILTPDYRQVPDIPALSVPALGLTNPSRILASDQATVPAEIFGKEPEHGWCYFFEKADLAAQQEDWASVVEIGQQVEAKGYHPLASDSNVPSEWFPFIKGYAASGDWETAKTISLEAFQRDSRIAPAMCSLWKGLNSSFQGGEDASADIQSQLQCN